MRIPFKIESAFNKIFKPQIVTIVETFVDDKPLKKFYGKSLTGNFLQFVYAQFNNNSANFAVSGAPWSSRNTVTSNVNTQINVGAVTMRIDAALNDATKGIVCGVGVAAVAPGDYVMSSQIAHGSGAGQFLYGVQTSSQGSVIAGANTSFVLERLFTNNSGGAITVNEVGLFINNSGQFLIYRDLVSPGDLVPAGSVYRVKLTFQITT